MNKILMVTTIPDTLSAFLLPFADHFRSQGWRVDALAQGISTNTECLQAFDRVWEVKWSRNPLDPRNLLIAPQVLTDLIKQERYDIVHVHTPVAAFVTRYALRNLPKQSKPQVIYTAHGFHFFRGEKPLKNAAFLSLEKIAGSWTDYLVVINQEDEKAVKQHWLVPPERMRYMPGIGVDRSRYSSHTTSEADVERVRQELEIAPETPLFLSVAEFIKRKRHQDILKAFARLKHTACLAFAGEGPLMQQMQQLAIELGIEKQVRFLGYRQDIKVLLRASAASVLASSQEGLPRSVMESLCLETPAIGADIRGIRDLLTEDCGLLIKVGDVEGLVAAFNWILEHPQEARMMGMRGRERMATYDLQQVIKLHESLYAEAMLKKSVCC
ncbi:MAG: glycosyltransferase [Nostocaceae cyanobacterium]|nr:glycosyltransferase [Nostocaceae cyanobacterium]